MSAYGHEMEREYSARSLSRGGSEMGSRYTTEELNSLDSDALPALCKDVDTLYVKEGQYKKDLNIMVGMVEDYFSSVRSQYDGRDVVLMDADDLVAETLFTYRIKEEPLHNISGNADQLKHIFIRKMYLKLHSDGRPLILFSRIPEKLHNATIEYLVSAGCRGWSSLIMRKENEMQMDFQEFLSRQRIMLQKEGSRIIAVISSQMDALRGSCFGDHVFKIPSPMYRYSSKDNVESQIQKSK
ncbi:Acid phosphatase [Handroanthus impetiginosus]|uniref:Acid phosphatase n=1 Tax=Handroanthus impetiginosus TaxID=429701 RepID=A0A2G9GZ90_9LAMI|nr:Acid phosphatase [Handroanthus impetiginosus]